MIKIESIPSNLPNWYSPDEPDFKRPASWDGARVHITIPVSVDPVKELEEARKRLATRYPGATLHLTPDFINIDSPTNTINVKGTDEDLLRQYFSKLSLPEHVTKEQIIAYLIKFLPSITSFGVKGTKFLSVSGSNVLCFEQCDWNLDEKGLTLITGKNEDWNNRSNGSGKSSWVSLPFIGLFGKTFKDQTHDEWANQNNDKPAKLETILELQDKRILKIIRQRRPGLLRVFINNKEVTMGTPNTTQKLIEQLTNLTWEVLTNSLYIGQSEIGSVFGTEKERKELFSRLLGLERFLTVQATLRKIALRIQRSAESVQSDIDSSNAALTEAKDSLRGLQFSYKQLPKVSEKEIKNLEQELNQNKLDTELQEKFKEKLLKQREALSERLTQCLKSINTCETIIQLQEKNLEATRKAKERCHICGNKVDAKVLAKYQQELTNVIIKERQEQKLHQADEKKWRELIEKSKTEERSINSLINKLRENEKSAFYELETLKQSRDSSEHMKKMLIERKTRIQTLERNKQIHEQAKNYTLEEKQFLDICINAVSRDGLPAYLCAVVAPQLNKTASYYSEKFSEGEIGIQFISSDGDVDVNICNLHGGKNIKDQSAGEMRIAGIITAFTFRDVLVPLNLLICDEPGENLDASNALAFAKGLNQIIDRFQHIIVISHNSNILGALEPTRHIEIVKKDGISSYSTINQ